MPSVDLPNNGNVWQTTEPVKGSNNVPASDKHYWQAKSSNSSSSGDLSFFLDIFVFPSNFKVQTVDFHVDCST